MERLLTNLENEDVVGDLSELAMFPVNHSRMLKLGVVEKLISLSKTTKSESTLLQISRCFLFMSQAPRTAEAMIKYDIENTLGYLMDFGAGDCDYFKEAPEDEAPEPKVKPLILKYVPNPDVEPCPMPKYRDGAALFMERYAAEFAEKHPDASTKYNELKTTHKDDPIIKRAVSEYSEERDKHQDEARMWREKWPEEAERMKEVCFNHSKLRRERRHINQIAYEIRKEREERKRKRFEAEEASGVPDVRTKMQCNAITCVTNFAKSEIDMPELTPQIAEYLIDSGSSVIRLCAAHALSVLDFNDEDVEEILYNPEAIKTLLSMYLSMR